MNKPFSIARKDFVTDIEIAINNSGLPIGAVVDILDNIQVQLVAEATKQYQKDLAEWRQANSENETDD